MTRVLMGVVHLRLALPVCLLALACSAAPAVATFPGRNGSIVVINYFSIASSGFGGSESLSILNPRTIGERTVRRCVRPAHYEPPSGCFLEGARVSPDGRRLAVLVSDATRTKSFLELTTLRGVVLSRVAAGSSVSLAWAPDGRSLLASRTAGEGLFEIGLDGQVRRQVATGDVGGADWSSKGDIAFSRPDGLYATRIGGQEKRIGAGEAPSWSPDGRRLAFRVGERITVSRADGTRARTISRIGGIPRWSPDGRRIALGALHTVKPNGRGLRRLYTGCSFYCSFGASDWQPLRRRR